MQMLLDVAVVFPTRDIVHKYDCSVHVVTFCSQSQGGSRNV